MIRDMDRERAPAIGADPLTETLRATQVPDRRPARPYPARVTMPLRDLLALLLVLAGVIVAVVAGFLVSAVVGLFVIAGACVVLGVLVGLGT